MILNLILPRWILEYDGIQHFEFIMFFYKTISNFHEYQRIDMMKTKVALQQGFNIIRIDYTQLNNIPFHINQAITYNQPVYFSTPELYSHISL